MKLYSTIAFLWLGLFCSFGFVIVHVPYILNDTDQWVQISVRFADGKRSFRLAPHAAHAEGQDGLVITEILVRYADGDMQQLRRREIEKLRERKHVDKELWVVQSHSIELFDLRYARQLKHL